MESIKRLLQFLNDNWSAIIVILSLIFSIAYKVKSFLEMSKEAKKQAAWDGIKKIILSLVANAETNWGASTGEIKKSEVIQEIYKLYPQLKDIDDQTSVERGIDAMIEKALWQMKEIINNTNNENLK